MLREKYILGVRRQEDRYRDRRSLSTEMEDNEPHHREKRRINGNPCINEKAMRTTIIFGVDSETGDVVELFHDPSKNKIHPTKYLFFIKYTNSPLNIVS